MPDESMTPLDQRQIDFAVRCCAAWLRIKAENGQTEATSADAAHSALLRRLLSGKPALDKPPALPTCYELGEGNAVPVWPPIDIDPQIGASVAIDGWACWDWHDREAKIVKHRPTGDLYRLFLGEQEYGTIAPPGPPRREKRPCWFLQKMDATKETRDA